MLVAMTGKWTWFSALNSRNTTQFTDACGNYREALGELRVRYNLNGLEDRVLSSGARSARMLRGAPRIAQTVHVI